MTNEKNTKIELLQALELKKFYKENLPHLHAHKLYIWQREFIDSVERISLLCAANQIGKSSCSIIKCIRWATERDLWPKLWSHQPSQFWYLYPNKDTLKREILEKWVKVYLPRNDYKREGKYSWHLYRDKTGFPERIHFLESDVTVWFFTYTQKPDHMQASTVDAVFADEELPEELYDELQVRLNKTKGYLSNVFTATLILDYLRRAFEPEEYEDENFPDAFKRQISMYECLEYEDGTPSEVWTIERIEEIKSKLSSEDEIKKRVYGRYVRASGLKYSSFNPTYNFKPFHHIPSDWYVYVGIDYGSGGKRGHPSAICFVGVSQDYTKARIFKFWRGDKTYTTAGDVIEKYKEMAAGVNVTAVFYDFAAADLGILSMRQSLGFQRANKDRELGCSLINTLFKTRQLVIYETPDFESVKLKNEFLSLRASTSKSEAKDDGIDSMRYAISRIPFNIIPIPVNEANNMTEEEELLGVKAEDKQPKTRRDYSREKRDEFYETIEDYMADAFYEFSA